MVIWLHGYLVIQQAVPIVISSINGVQTIPRLFCLHECLSVHLSLGWPTFRLPVWLYLYTPIRESVHPSLTSGQSFLRTFSKTLNDPLFHPFSLMFYALKTDTRAALNQTTSTAPVNTCMYEGCPQSTKPFWISREPVAWPWCNLAASQRRPYCASVNSGASQSAVRRRWLSLCTVWPSHSQWPSEQIDKTSNFSCGWRQHVYQFWIWNTTTGWNVRKLFWIYWHIVQGSFQQCVSRQLPGFIMARVYRP
jgi:hypothetical protein